MKERPILFGGEMVRAILDGRKTQTRRIISKRVKHPDAWFTSTPTDFATPEMIRENWPCPYGQPGDRLWVRETFSFNSYGASTRNGSGWLDYINIEFKADGEVLRFDSDNETINRHLRSFQESEEQKIWKPSIHMPRWASRILLEITDVRVERLQDIHHNEKDLRAEGIALPPTELYPHTNTSDKLEVVFKRVWESINGPGSWDRNDWVWVITFKRVQP